MSIPMAPPHWVFRNAGHAAAYEILLVYAHTCRKLGRETDYAWFCEAIGEDPDDMALLLIGFKDGPFSVMDRPISMGKALKHLYRWTFRLSAAMRPWGGPMVGLLAAPTGSIRVLAQGWDGGQYFIQTPWSAVEREIRCIEAAMLAQETDWRFAHGRLSLALILPPWAQALGLEVDRRAYDGKRLPVRMPRDAPLPPRFARLLDPERDRVLIRRLREAVEGKE